MARTITRIKSGKANSEFGERGRDADSPSAPIRVSEHAQARISDVPATRQFDFDRDRNQLPERPSTSGGPANDSMRKNIEKGETRDDLYVHFNPLGVHGRETRFHDFPHPGTLPTTGHPTKPYPAVLANSSLQRSNTQDPLDSRPMALNAEQTEIGMALGSPSHQPLSWPQHVSIIESNMSSSSPDQAVDDSANSAPPLKQKSSKWKVLGGLFGGGKKHSSPQAFYQVQPELPHHTTVSSNYVDFDEPATASEKNDKKPTKSRGRGRTTSRRKAGKHKPDLKTAQTAPLEFDFHEHNGRMLAPMPEITIDGGPMLDTILQPKQQGLDHGGLMLDVTIPSVQMERYSIMFGSVLQKPVSTTTNSSLLARRQATLDKLKTVHEELVLKEQELEEKSKFLRPRGATSPQPNKSPAFSLFPSTPSRLTVRGISPSFGHRASPLQRSNTSPAALSPSRPSFAPQAVDEIHALLMGPAPHLTVDPRSNERISNHKPREPNSSKPSSKQPANNSTKPQEVNHNWLPEESRLALDSPDSERGEATDVYDPASFPLRPKLEEPDWQMIAPHSYQAPPSLSGSISSRSDSHSTSTSESSISFPSTLHNATPKHGVIQPPPTVRRNRSATTSSASRPRPAEVSNSAFGSLQPSPPKPIAIPGTDREDAHEREERLKYAADISIARQISVSRQQRQLLIPIKKPSSPSHNKSLNPNFPFPSPLKISRVVSPLGVVAAAAESPIVGKSGNPSARLERKNTERLVPASANASTPTLVVVGSGKSEVEKAWSGHTAVNSPAVEGRGTGSVEIRVGLVVASSVELVNRKSERVVVDSVRRREGRRG